MKLLSSKKAGDGGTMSLMKSVIITLLLIAIVVFVILPLVTKPLGTDPCLQQNGVRAPTCDSDVAHQNNFIEADKTNNVCCIAVPGMKDEFKAWSESVTASTDPDDHRQIVEANNAAEKYGVDSNHMAIFAPPKPGKLVDDYYVTGKVFFPPNNNGKTLDLKDDPTRTFDLVGVNNLADGVCSLVVREAAAFKDNSGKVIEYKPKTTGTGSYVTPEPGFNYQNNDCKQGQGVQITGSLRGLVGEDSYYIATYSVKGKDAEGVEKTLQVHALIKAQLEGTTGGTGDSTDDTESDVTCTIDCKSYTTAQECISYTKGTSTCAGCNWIGDGFLTKDHCEVCVIKACNQYDSQESCERDPCWINKGCSWTSNECYAEALIEDCKDYPDKDTCNADSACEWKWLSSKPKCKEIPKEELTPGDTMNELEGQ